MRRRAFLGAGTAALLASARGWGQDKRVARIGLLWIRSTETGTYTEALREALRGLGHAVGAGVVLDESFLVPSYDALPQAAQRLATSNVDLVVTLGATATQAAVKSIKRIPIVFVTASDPVSLGIVSNLSRPGGNATGITLSSNDLDGKRIELLKNAFPKTRHVAVLFYPGSAAERNAVKDYVKFGRTFDMEVRPVEVPDLAAFDAAAAALPGRVDAIIIVGSTLFLAHRKEIIASIARTRLPAMFSQPAYVDDGGLFSYGSTTPQLLAQATPYIDKILRGAHPGDLPVEQQNRFELVINTRTAKALGIEFPQALLLRADRVVE